MGKLTLLICLLLMTQYTLSAQTKIEIEPSQSMLMTGKGPGQDGAINPFYGQNCLAVIENIGETAFSIRTQKDGEILAEIPIQKGEVKKIRLLKGHELYFDAESGGMAKAEVNFEPMVE